MTLRLPITSAVLALGIAQTLAWASSYYLLAVLADPIAKDTGMTVPAVLFLQSIRPLSAIGSQALIFLRPFLTPLFKPAEYDRVAGILEQRDGIAALVDAIEAAESAREGALP